MEQEQDTGHDLTALHRKIDRFTQQIEHLTRFLETSPAVRTLPAGQVGRTQAPQ